jgi:hypothetical protein
MAYDATMALAKAVEDASNQCLKRQTLSAACIRNHLQPVLIAKDFKANGILGKNTVQFDAIGDRKISYLSGETQGVESASARGNQLGLEDKLGALVCVQQQGGDYIFQTLPRGRLCP